MLTPFRKIFGPFLSSKQMKLCTARSCRLNSLLNFGTLYISRRDEAQLKFETQVNYDKVGL